MTQTYGIQWDSTDTLPFTPTPAKPCIVAHYANGRFRAPLHYGKGSVFIDVTGGIVAEVPGWLDERARFGEGGIYCNRDTLPAVEQAAGDRPHFLWIATLDGTLDVALPAGCGHLVAVQLFGEAMLPFHADMSLVLDAAYWDKHHS
jgi:hypothetical protein